MDLILGIVHVALSIGAAFAVVFGIQSFYEKKKGAGIIFFVCAVGLMIISHCVN